jgi:hypothetical protein
LRGKTGCKRIYPPQSDLSAQIRVPSKFKDLPPKTTNCKHISK